jgi:hypothetical protein
VLVSVAMTTPVTPVVLGVYRTKRRLVGYKRRNLQRIRHDSELRMLACVHTTRNVPSVLSLLDLSNPSKRSPIFIYALHLVELTGRASNMLAAAAASASSHGRSGSASSLPAVTDHIFNAFEEYERLTGGVSIQTLAAVSPYQTMHEDVSVLAEDKHVSLIVVPFHKQQTVDGGMEPINPSIRAFNENLLATSPCSVAILVDRGLSAAAARMASEHNVALFFFGGPDDREALAYAWRMVENPGVTLSVVRFLPPDYRARSVSASSASSYRPLDVDSRAITISPDQGSKSELEMDEDYLNEFRSRNHGNSAISYSLKTVANSEETVAAIRNMDTSLHELYVVGRRPGEAGSSMTSALEEWMENPELGPIGDMLVSSDFSMSMSLLVVQQYVVAGAPVVAAAPAPAANNDPVRQYLSNANQQPAAESGAYRTSGEASNNRWSGSSTGF